MYAARISRQQPPAGRRPLVVSRPDDERERRAEQVAEQVMRSTARPAGSSTQDVRAVLGARFGVDFSHVRIHQDAEAQRLAHSVGARAFTRGSDIYYGRGAQPAVDTLTAHEFSHVVRPAPVIQRTLEVRPPGRGEASAFDRRQEFIDRLNKVATAAQFRLDMDDRTILYHVTDQGGLSAFDRQMITFIDGAQLIPLRLISGAGKAPLPGGGFSPVVADAFETGYVDLDDLLASDDTAFMITLVHLVTERRQVPNYARRIGTPLMHLFAAAHRAGHEAEVLVLRDILGDPTIRFSFEEIKPGTTTAVRAFKSGKEGYLVFHRLRGITGDVVSNSEMRVVKADGTRLSLDDFLAERRAAAVPGP
jgi:hypothetical protein